MDEITDLDIYYDLDDYAKTHEKKSEEVAALDAKYKESLRTIEALTLENKNLKKQNKNTEVNFQNLLETARTEINRKNRQIAELRKELDDVCFRRKNHRADADRREFDGDRRAARGNPFRSATVAAESEQHIVRKVFTVNEPFCLPATTTRPIDIMSTTVSAGGGKSTPVIEKNVFTQHTPMGETKATEGHRNELLHQTSQEQVISAHHKTIEKTSSTSIFDITQKNAEDCADFKRKSRDPRADRVPPEENVETSRLSRRRDSSGSSHSHSKYANKIEPCSTTAPRKIVSLQDYKQRGNKDHHRSATDDRGDKDANKRKPSKYSEEKYKSRKDDHRDSRRSKNSDARDSSKYYDKDHKPAKGHRESRRDRSSDKRHSSKKSCSRDHDSTDVNRLSNCDRSSERDTATSKEALQPTRTSAPDHVISTKLEATDIQLKYSEYTRNAETILEKRIDAEIIQKYSSKERKADKNEYKASKESLSKDSKEVKTKVNNDQQRETSKSKEHQQYQVKVVADTKGKAAIEHKTEGALICQAAVTHDDITKNMLSDIKYGSDSLSRSKSEKEEATTTQNIEEPNNIKLNAEPAATEIEETYELYDIPGLGDLNNSNLMIKKPMAEQPSSKALSTPQKVAIYNELFMQKPSKSDAAVGVELFANVMQILNAPKKGDEKLPESILVFEKSAGQEVVKNPENEKLTATDILAHHEHLTLEADDFEDLNTSRDSARLTIDEDDKAFDELNLGQLKVDSKTERGESANMKLGKKGEDNEAIVKMRKNETIASIDVTSGSCQIDASPARMDEEIVRTVVEASTQENRKRGCETVLDSFEDTCEKDGDEKVLGKASKPESFQADCLKFDEKNLLVSKCLKDDDVARPDDVQGNARESPVAENNSEKHRKPFEPVLEDISAQTVEGKLEVSDAEKSLESLETRRVESFAFEDVSNELPSAEEVASNAKKPHIEIIEVIDLPIRYELPKKDIQDGAEQEDCQPHITPEKPSSTVEKASSPARNMDTDECTEMSPVTGIVIEEASNLVLDEAPRSVVENMEDSMRIGVDAPAQSSDTNNRTELIDDFSKADTEVIDLDDSTDDEMQEVKVVSNATKPATNKTIDKDILEINLTSDDDSFERQGIAKINQKLSAYEKSKLLGASNDILADTKEMGDKREQLKTLDEKLELGTPGANKCVVKPSKPKEVITTATLDAANATTDTENKDDRKIHEENTCKAEVPIHKINEVSVPRVESPKEIDRVSQKHNETSKHQIRVSSTETSLRKEGPVNEDLEENTGPALVKKLLDQAEKEQATKDVIIVADTSVPPVMSEEAVKMAIDKEQNDKRTMAGNEPEEIHKRSKNISADNLRDDSQNQIIDLTADTPKKAGQDCGIEVINPDVARVDIHLKLMPILELQHESENPAKRTVPAEAKHIPSVTTESRTQARAYGMKTEAHKPKDDWGEEQTIESYLEEMEREDNHSFETEVGSSNIIKNTVDMNKHDICTKENEQQLDHNTENSSSIKDGMGSVTNAHENQSNSILNLIGKQPLLKGFRIPIKRAPNLVEPLRKIETQLATEKPHCDNSLIQGVAACKKEEQLPPKAYNVSLLEVKRAEETALEIIDKETEIVDLKMEISQTETQKKLLVAKENTQKKLELHMELRCEGNPFQDTKIAESQPGNELPTKKEESTVTREATSVKPQERALPYIGDISQQSEKRLNQAQREKPQAGHLPDEGDNSQQSVKLQISEQIEYRLAGTAKPQERSAFIKNTEESMDLKVNQIEQKLSPDHEETFQKKDITLMQRPQSVSNTGLEKNVGLMPTKSKDSDRSIKSSLASTKHKDGEKIIPYESMLTITNDEDTGRRQTYDAEVNRSEEECNLLESRGNEIKENRKNEIKESTKSETKEYKKHQGHHSKAEKKANIGNNNKGAGVTNSVTENDKESECPRNDYKFKCREDNKAENEGHKYETRHVTEIRKEQTESQEKKRKEPEMFTVEGRKSKAVHNSADGSRETKAVKQHEIKDSDENIEVNIKSTETKAIEAKLETARQHKGKESDGKIAEDIKITEKDKIETKPITESKLKMEQGSEVHRHAKARKIGKNQEDKVKPSADNNRKEKSEKAEKKKDRQPENKKVTVLREEEKGRDKKHIEESKGTRLSEREDRCKTERKIREESSSKANMKEIKREKSEFENKHKQDNGKSTARKRLRSFAEESDEDIQPVEKVISESKYKETSKTINKARSEVECKKITKISEAMKVARSIDDVDNKTEKRSEKASSKGKKHTEIISESNQSEQLNDMEANKREEKKDSAYINTASKKEKDEKCKNNARVTGKNEELENHLDEELTKIEKPIINPTALSAESIPKDKIQSLIVKETREKCKNEMDSSQEMGDSSEVNCKAVGEVRQVIKKEAIEEGKIKGNRVESTKHEEKLEKSKKERTEPQAKSNLEKLFKEMEESGTETSMDDSFKEKTPCKKRVTNTKKTTKANKNIEKTSEPPENKIEAQKPKTSQTKRKTKAVTKKICEIVDAETKAKGRTRKTKLEVEPMTTPIIKDNRKIDAHADELIQSTENVVKLRRYNTENKQINCEKDAKFAVEVDSSETHQPLKTNIDEATLTAYTQPKKPISPTISTPKPGKKRKCTKLSENNNNNAAMELQPDSKKPKFGDNFDLSPISTVKDKVFRTKDEEGQKKSPVSSMANFSPENNFMDIDKRLQHMFESPPCESTLRPTEQNVYVSEMLESSIASTVVRPQCDINSHLDITIEETRGDSLTLGASSLLHDSSGSVGTKSFTLGNNDYRFEKVSDNVVNLFITRRRGKKKRKVDNGAAADV